MDLTELIVEVNSPVGLTGLLCIGFGLVFFAVDFRSATTRAFSLSFVARGLALLVSVVIMFGAFNVAALGIAFNGVAILAGIEWGRRVGRTGTTRWHSGANWVYRAAQLLAVVYTGMSFGYLLIAPELALAGGGDVIRVQPIEWAVLAPILSTSMGLALLASIIVLAAGIDRAERYRLWALGLSAPFMLTRLFLSDAFVPLMTGIGLLILLGGNLRYLTLVGKRGQFMRQFLSPQVATVVHERGIDGALARDRRDMSVVMCDLRGFTELASSQSSEQVFSLLEAYYGAVGDVAARFGATIKDHAGDGVLMLVGAPIADDEHAATAVKFAKELCTTVNERLGYFGVEIGVGVASGDVTVGAIHGAGRLEYAAVGSTINLAARLCDQANGGEVIFAADTAIAAAQNGVAVGAETARGTVELKGFNAPVSVARLQLS